MKEKGLFGFLGGWTTFGMTDIGYDTFETHAEAKRFVENHKNRKPDKIIEEID